MSEPVAIHSAHARHVWPKMAIFDAVVVDDKISIDRMQDAADLGNHATLSGKSVEFDAVANQTLEQ